MSFIIAATAVLALGTCTSALSAFCLNPTAGFAWPKNINREVDVRACSTFTVKWNVPDDPHPAKDDSISFELLCGPSSSNLKSVQDIGTVKNSAKSFEWSVNPPKECLADGVAGLQMRSVEHPEICQTSSSFNITGGGCDATTASSAVASSAVASAVESSAVASAESAVKSAVTAVASSVDTKLPALETTQAKANKTQSFGLAEATEVHKEMPSPSQGGNNGSRDKTQPFKSTTAEGTVNGTSSLITEIRIETAIELVIQGARAAGVSKEGAQVISNACRNAVGDSGIKTEADAAKVVGTVAAAAASVANDENMVSIVVSCVQKLVFAMMEDGPVGKSAVGVSVAAAASREEPQTVIDCVGALFKAAKQNRGSDTLLSAQVGQSVASVCKKEDCRILVTTTLKATARVNLQSSMSILAAVSAVANQASGQEPGQKRHVQDLADQCIERVTEAKPVSQVATVDIIVQSFGTLSESALDKITQAATQAGDATRAISEAPRTAEQGGPPAAVIDYC
ncbi:hypothetical protein G6O67_008670 [Ophiocordyceps sinensis]|uniref:Yeast cell wall synthesis Kre9/Knh1-like N-terminal domain-containing protein n=1 Tax=Ophiocordyceps sinensis TaxID=72228 RepID=A0A8H4LSB9_9HYPO|nr:hypothetical protein G6O67_008670 [Ophiocordyceps sinensis]